MSPDSAESQKKAHGTPEHLPEGVEQSLARIEHELRRIRGSDGGDPSPWDFAVPTKNELYQMRERSGLSREELAEIIDYTPDTIRQYEKGTKTPGREYIRRALLAFRREWPRGDRSV